MKLSQGHSEMNTLQRVFHAVRPTARKRVAASTANDGFTVQPIPLAVHTPMGEQRPKLGRVLNPRPEDVWRDYPSRRLTPSKLMGILRDADAGSLSAAMQLYEEMEEKDPHLYAVANTRRLALTGLEWTIEPDRAEGISVQSAQNDPIVEYCRTALNRIEMFDETLQHLSLAIGRNIAIAELVWEDDGRSLQLADIVPVDFARIVFDELDRPRILTEEFPFDGMELAPHKFVVHAPQCASGHAQRGGLLRVSAMSYLGKNLAIKDWMVFAEIFGMPVRIARYEPSATEDEKREMLRMLESLGSNAAGIFSRAIDLQIVETGRGGRRPPYESMVEYFNREMSKAWLGQTLTTDTTGSRGTFAASSVHAQVRQDVLADDLRKEARTVRRDILTPLVRFRFGADAPIPRFRRKPRRAGTTQELADLLATAVNELGAKVPVQWTHDSLGIPRASEGEDVLNGTRR